MLSVNLVWAPHLLGEIACAFLARNCSLFEDVVKLWLFVVKGGDTHIEGCRRMSSRFQIHTLVRSFRYA